MNTLIKVAVALLIVFVVFCSAALLFSARPTPIAGVDAGSLAHSVRSPGTGCSELPEGQWNCAIEGNRANTHYLIDIGWDGCWDATRVKGPITEDTPETFSGCIDIWDHLALENTFD